MKTGSYLAATLLAVTMTVATAGAQDPGPPPNDPQAQAPGQGQTPDQGQQADPNTAQNPNDGQNPGDSENPNDQRPSLRTVSQQQNGPNADPNGDQPYDPKSEDPKNSVARVSLVRGEVNMQRGDASEWSAVTLNTPLVQGDQIATGNRGRAEIELDFANMVRLAAGTQVKIADLGHNRIQLQVAQGYASYSVFKNNESDIEIDTPNVAIHPTRAGRYRVQVSSEGETNLIVREGEAEVSTSQGSTTVKQGELITIRGTDDPEYKVEAAPPADDWDKWNIDRDQTIQSAGSWDKTNRYYTGSQDLDANGRWINVPGYGQVWQPYDQERNENWAPYQDGRWVWEPGWGWTWVSYEPWGWAPYHYGRWFYWDTGWVWWPGPTYYYPYYRPLWAPAYVSFFGFGGHFGVGVGFGWGSVGWLPCGPFDPFFPWYGRGFGRVTVVNFNTFVVNRGFGGGHFIGPIGIRGRMTEFSNTRMAMTNPRVRAGITSVSREDFARGGMGSRHFGADPGQLHNAHMMTSNVPVTPTRESLRTGGTHTGFTGVSSNTRFMSTHSPSQGPAGFHEQAPRIQNMVSNPRVTMSQGGNGSFSRPATTGQMAQAQNPGNSSNSGARNGWSRFGGSNGQSPRNSAGPNVGSPGGSGNRGAWGGSSGASASKPPLQMSKPIVTPRSSSPATSSTYGRGGYNGSSHGGYNGGGNYGGYNSSRPTSAPPRSYGGYSSPGSSGGYYGGRSSPSPSGGYYGGRSSSSPSGGYYGGRSSGSPSGGYYGGRTSGGGYGGSYGGGRSSGGYSGGGGYSRGSSGGGHSGGGGGGGGHSNSSGGGHSNSGGHM